MPLFLINLVVLVLCTAPYKYQVVDPEGVIKASSCVDIVVRHTAILASNCNMIDKFRIQMHEYPTKQVIFITWMIERSIHSGFVANLNFTNFAR